MSGEEAYQQAATLIQNFEAHLNDPMFLRSFSLDVNHFDCVLLEEPMGDVYLRCDFPDCPVEMLYLTASEHRNAPSIGEERVKNVNWGRIDMGNGRTVSFCPMHRRLQEMGILNLEGIWKVKLDAMRQKTTTTTK